MLQSIWIGCYISLVESRSMILAMIKGSGCYCCNCLLFYIQFMRGQLYSNRPRSITRGFIKWCRNLHHCYKMIGMRLTLSLDSWIQLWRCSVICDAFHPDKFDSGALLRLKHITYNSDLHFMEDLIHISFCATSWSFVLFVAHAAEQQYMYPKNEVENERL